ncbi:arid/bright DNA binding domain-containing protein [Colletotrichum higginsianum]|uniref:Arid/bright DNA binding domain-containing protein n=2 Tax=Colletotrichum higginsianum TaxID=80884 RepID=H1V5Q1_COLHI|nr:Arid/bright DNA binding domain-containing protein [Colletotrichum higginsianum IMI 349063]OBR05410.1 Arid/bright DNA binding domain-containing protein [Colletotrichum higginsianum IMI 349063]TIC94280.1 SWI/SNF chromatin-remodeling complex subunit sol1 [Colletotrichum higginsianum]CCF35553.1 arid/bright DNA binding domain-containing protein [Colletotrichum higginsianum]
MSTWMNEAAVPNHNGNAFPHMNDSNAAGAMMDPSAFMGSPAHFNPAQFANPQQAQQAQQQQVQHHQQQQQQQQQQQMAAMQNGQMRNASPSSFQNPAYQTNSVVPSKRPRPREDSIAGSPRQNPGMLPTSRSETPQTFPGYQPGMPQQAQGQPSPYPHLQPNGSANATPSPIMANQLRPGSVPQRVATASPHPFSPGAQQFAPQASPNPSEHGTPQPNHYMQQNMQNMPQGYNPNFNPSQSPARPSPNPNAMAASGMMPQQMGQMPQHMGQMPNQMLPPNMQPRNPMEQQQMAAYQARLAKQLQQGTMQGMQNMQNMQNMQSMQNMQMAAQMQAQNMAQGRGMMPKQPMQMPNGQMQPGAMRPQPQQRPMPGSNPESFMKSLNNFMAAKGQQLDPNPVIGNRPVNLLTLFQSVQSKGGYKPTTAGNQWPHVSNSIGFHPGQIPQAPQMLKEIYERNLLRFEEAWVAQQSRQRMMQHHNQPGMPGQPGQPGQPGPPIPPGAQPQSTPTKQQMSPQGHLPPQQPMMPQSQPNMPPQQVQTPVKQGSFSGQPPSVNGFQTPQAPGPHTPATAQQGHARNSLSRSVEPTPGHPQVFPSASPASVKGGGMPMAAPPGMDQNPMAASIKPRMLRLAHESDEYTPSARPLETYGGINVRAFDLKGLELQSLKPDIPPPYELGYVDLHALTRSLESGIHGEVRLALDTLATVTATQHQALHIHLKYCEELIEALLECAEEQLDLLVENTEEASADIQLAPYEDVARACWTDKMGVRELPKFGSLDYELDRAVERFSCVITILRNLSFPEASNENHLVLGDELVIKFLCVVIRYLGTRNMLFRTNANTLEFMKDAIILLSNIAGAVEIPGREQALCLLHFLLAFAPAPGPTTMDDKLYFPPYQPGVHTYTFHAVDALARFLARDEPNRTHYKMLYSMDASSSPPYDLLTRSFALATTVVPIQSPESAVAHIEAPERFFRLVEDRKPWLMQGLLAADILASLAPGYETGVAKSWLSSGNGFAQALYHFVQVLGAQFEQPWQTRSGQGDPAGRDTGLVYIATSGISTLRRLAEKSRDPNDPRSSVPADSLPSEESLFKMMLMRSPDWTKDGVIRNLAVYASVDS